MRPSKPTRKGPSINVSPTGTPKTGDGIPKPTTKAVAPFGSIDKSVYKRPSAGVTPTGVPINDKDGGNALKRGTGHNPNIPRLKSGVIAAE